QLSSSSRSSFFSVAPVAYGESTAIWQSVGQSLRFGKAKTASSRSLPRQTCFSSPSVDAMVTDGLAEEDFVRCDWLDLSQLELDRCSRAESYAVAVTFAGRIRIS